MQFFSKSFVGLLIALFLSVFVKADAYLLMPSNVLDVSTGRILDGYQVHVQDDKIVQIGKNLTVDRAVKRIDLSGLTLMPGLIDAHSHVLLHPYNEVSWNDQVLKESWAERTLRAGNHLGATLDAGFTSLRDLGSEGAGYMDVGIRDAVNKGVIEGPRLIVAGKAIVSTGSYGPKGFDLSHHINLGAEPADGADLIHVVRDQIGKGADIIKVYADYRWGPNGEAKPTFTLDELKTIVQIANDSGRPAVAHAASDEAMRRAILAGVQSIEHGDGGSFETFKLMAEKGVIFCPTIAAGDAISRYRGWDGSKASEPARIGQKRTSMELALKAGVEICNGSDVGVFTHGDNARELELLVTHGLTNLDALKAATYTSAKLMNIDGLGLVKEGYLADIIAVSGNPIDDLSAIRRVEFVMKNGKIYKKP
ncbi:amidohydrolase family protein [Kordiimonas sp. SCSIO 12610]|uniref:metal-dependent hydrolase family protein n=1 Tax=Kordiimonas sp. SCSIO 12610 TaxID=2829597 RepID=UPI00210C2838|nr:amidohydrolase family protein [Kordiimonas sp. SCSIO 12610]UTW54884.1 amidohydrolase family protein [Kordiimonas sp. SCSIO 12610]